LPQPRQQLSSTMIGRSIPFSFGVLLPFSLYHFSKTEKIGGGGGKMKWNEHFLLCARGKKKKQNRTPPTPFFYFISSLFLHNHCLFIYDPHMHFFFYHNTSSLLSPTHGTRCILFSLSQGRMMPSYYMIFFFTTMVI
jgi:hypothetical protein